MSSRLIRVLFYTNVICLCVVGIVRATCPTTVDCNKLAGTDHPTVYDSFYQYCDSNGSVAVGAHLTGGDKLPDVGLGGSGNTNGHASCLREYTYTGPHTTCGSGDGSCQNCAESGTYEIDREEYTGCKAEGATYKCGTDAKHVNNSAIGGISYPTTRPDHTVGGCH